MMLTFRMLASQVCRLRLEDFSSGLSSYDIGCSCDVKDIHCQYQMIIYVRSSLTNKQIFVVFM